MSHLTFAGGVLGAGLQALNLYALLGIVAALLLGGMVKGVVRRFRIQRLHFTF
jgi:uncharacterized protein